MARAPQMRRQDRQTRSLNIANGGNGNHQREVARGLAGLTAQLGQIQAVKQDAVRRQAAVDQAKSDAAAVRDATKQGHLTGADQSVGSLTLRPDDTDANRAYNAAATRSYFSKLEHSARSGLSNIEAQYNHDPNLLQEKITAFKSGFGGAVPEILQQDMDLMMSRLSDPFITQARRKQEKTVLANDIAAAQSQVSTRLGDLSRSAYLSDMDLGSDEALAGQIDGLQNLLVQHGPKTAFEVNGQKFEANPARSGVYAPAAIAELVEGARQDAALKRVEGSFSRLEGFAEQSAFAQEFTADFTTGKGAASTFSPDQYEAMQSTMARALNGHKAAALSQRSEIRQNLRDLGSVVSNGLDPGEDALAKAQMSALASGDPDLIAQYNTLASTRNFIGKMRSASPAQLKTFIASVEDSEGGVTKDVSDKVKLARNFQSKMSAGLSKDPLGWAEQSGLFDVPALDFTDDNLPDQLMKRRQTADAVSDYYGIDPTYFSPEERDGLARFADGGKDQVLQVARSLASADEATSLKMAGELFKDAPMVANLGAMTKLGFNSSIVDAAAEGMELRKMDGWTSRLPPKADIQNTISEAYGTAFAAMPQAYDASVQTALSAAEAQSFRAGLTSDNFPGDRFERNLQEVLGATYDRSNTQFGGIAKVNGREIVAPRFMMAHRVEDVISRLEADDWSRGGLYGPPVTLDGQSLTRDDLKNAYLESVGDGRYRVALTDTQKPGTQYAGTTDPDQPFYILDMSKLEDTIRADKKMRRWVKGIGQ